MKFRPIFTASFFRFEVCRRLMGGANLPNFTALLRQAYTADRLGSHEKRLAVMRAYSAATGVLQLGDTIALRDKTVHLDAQQFAPDLNASFYFGLTQSPRDAALLICAPTLGGANQLKLCGCECPKGVKRLGRLNPEGILILAALGLAGLDLPPALQQGLLDGFIPDDYAPLYKALHEWLG